jgi:hypothetical protein
VQVLELQRQRRFVECAFETGREHPRSSLVLRRVRHAYRRLSADHSSIETAALRPVSPFPTMVLMTAGHHLHP